MNWNKSSEKSLVYGSMCICRTKALSYFERSTKDVKTKRRDNKGRILNTGESQRKDGRYTYKYVDAMGKTRYVYSWKLLPTDRLPKGKRDDLSLREKERMIQRDLFDGIDTKGSKMTLCQLYAKKIAQRPNVKKNTQQGRKYLRTHWKTIFLVLGALTVSSRQTPEHGQSE